MSLPKNAEDRKRIPIVTGVLDYFPDAIAEVAKVSLAGNEQHHPGKPLHWDKTKSTDEADALGRHLMERGTRDKDGERHSAKVAWRALALLQREIEEEREADQGTPVFSEQVGQNMEFWVPYKLSTTYPTCCRCGDIVTAPKPYSDNSGIYCNEKCFKGVTGIKWGV